MCRDYTKNCVKKIFFFVKQEDKRSNRKNKTTKTKKVEKAENNGDIMKPRRKFRFFFCA